MKGEVVARGQEHADRTGDNVFYISWDVSNLGGLNNACGTEKANVHYRVFANILAQELAALGAQVIPMRTGGDEGGMTVTGRFDAQQLQAALQRARQRIHAYAKQQDLAEIPHRKGDGRKGVGMHLGSAPVLKQLTLWQVFTLADLRMNASKKKTQHDPAARDADLGVSEQELAALDAMGLDAEDALDEEVRFPLQRASAFFKAHDITAFPDPDAVAKINFTLRAARHNLSREAIEELAWRAARDYVTGHFEGRVDRAKSDLVRHGQAYALNTGQPVFFVVGELVNLGPLNAAMDNIADRANVHYRNMTSMAVEELLATGGAVVPMRIEGDKVGYLIIAPHNELLVESAMGRANKRTKAYADKYGLGGLVNPQNKDLVGVRMNFGRTAVGPEMTLANIFNQVERNLKHSKSEDEKAVRALRERNS